MASVQRVMKGSAVALLLLTLIISSSCSGTIPTDLPTDLPPDEEERFLEETIEALQTEVSSVFTPSVTAVPVSPTSPPLTATALPPPALSPPAATRIRFEPGATFATARGTIEPDRTQTFILEAQEDQPMLASVVSQDNDVTMSITTERDATLLPASEGMSIWQGTLPVTQEYYIQIIGGAMQQVYALSVSIPSRIEFSPGETSTTVSGRTVNGNITSYVVAAQGGQAMRIVLTPEPEAATLTVWGFSDGQPYLRAQAGATTFDMQLPSTQDYIIDVVPQAGQEVDFSLTVEIE